MDSEMLVHDNIYYVNHFAGIESWCGSDKLHDNYQDSPLAIVALVASFDCAWRLYVTDLSHLMA